MYDNAVKSGMDMEREPSITVNVVYEYNTVWRNNIQ